MHGIINQSFPANRIYSTHCLTTLPPKTPDKLSLYLFNLINQQQCIHYILISATSYLSTTNNSSLFITDCYLTVTWVIIQQQLCRCSNTTFSTSAKTTTAINLGDDSHSLSLTLHTGSVVVRSDSASHVGHDVDETTVVL